MAGNVRVSFVPLTKECYDYFFDPTSNPFVNAFFFLLQLDIVSNRTSFEQFFVAFETSLKEREKKEAEKIRERGTRLISGRIDRRFENPRFGRPLNLRSSGKFLEIIVAVASEKLVGG